MSYADAAGQVQRVSRASKVPLYQQLYDILLDKIQRYEWKPGDVIPSETELCEQYHVSRTTVRQVLGQLANEGFIERHRGRGTFVSEPTVEKSMERIVSFTQDMLERGLQPRTRVLSSELISAPSDIAEPLGVQPGEELTKLVRLRLADGTPMAIEESYLVHRYCPGVLVRDYSKEPLREVLEQKYGIRLTRAKQVIRAVPSNSQQSKWLAIRPKEPLLYIERVSYSQHDVAVEFLRIYYRADRYTLHNELKG